MVEYCDATVLNLTLAVDMKKQILAKTYRARSILNLKSLLYVNGL
jgi:hypothetical protein